jgi:predicted amidohydrolase YtcJ
MRIDAIFTDLDAHTLDPERPRASRIGVFNGRIIGFDEELDGISADRVESLGGATVLPGFTDAHCHTAWFGLTLASVDVTALPGGLPDVYAALEWAAAAAPAGEWINATGYAHRDYDGQYPDLTRLDEITGNRPLFMRQTSGHAAIVNTEAMRRAGILEPGFTEPVGGKVVRDPAGHPTGLLEETAQSLVQDLIRPYSLDTLVEAIDLATAHYAKEGITSFGECGIAYGWIGHSPIEISAYLRAREEGRLRARAQLMPQADGLHTIAANSADGFGIGLDAGLRTGLGDDLISIGPVKFFMDGALSGETAALRENYTGKDHPGYLQADAEAYCGSRSSTPAPPAGRWPCTRSATPPSTQPWPISSKRRSGTVAARCPTGSNMPEWSTTSTWPHWPRPASSSPRSRPSPRASATA